MARATEDAVTDALWQRVCDDFDSDKTHESFIAHCRVEGRLLEAARRYRERKEGLAEDDAARAVIDQRLSAIALLAMSEIDLQRTEPTKRNYLMIAIRVVAVLMTLFAVWNLMRGLSALRTP